MASKPGKYMTHEQRRDRASSVVSDFDTGKYSLEALAIKYGLSYGRVYEIVRKATPKKRGAK